MSEPVPFSTPVQPPMRFEGLQVLRGLAALAVLVCHLAENHVRATGEKLLPGLTLGWVGVDLFFVLSGFIIARSALNERAGVSSAAGFAFGRAARIYLPWWMALAATASLVAFNPDLLPYKGEADLWASIFLLPAAGQPLLSVGWTLVMEMAFYSVFAAILLFPPQWRLPVLAAWAGLIVLNGLMDLGYDTIPGHVLLDPLCLEFLAGVAIAKWLGAPASKQEPVRLYWLISGSALAMIAGASLVTVTIGSVPDHGAEWIRTVSVGGPAALIVWCVARLDLGAVRPGLLAPFWTRLVALGDRSYALYLVHYPALSATAVLLAGMVSGWQASLLFVVGGLLLSGLLTEALHRLVEQPSIRLSQWLKQTTYAAKLKQPILAVGSSTPSPQAGLSARSGRSRL
jgi:exopolysaccharide production protein ExoZ